MNINISGGSITKRHLLSPVHIRLAIFLIGANVLNNDRLIDSYYELSDQIWKPFVDNSRGITFEKYLHKSLEEISSNLKKEGIKPKDFMYSDLYNKFYKNWDTEVEAITQKEKKSTNNCIIKK
jgi:hypothetical protein